MGSKLRSAVSLGSLNQDLMGIALSARNTKSRSVTGYKRSNLRGLFVSRGAGAEGATGINVVSLSDSRNGPNGWGGF